MWLIDLFAAITTILCLILTAKLKVMAWPVGILSTILMAISFYNLELYGQTTLQLVYIIQGIIGWVYWNNQPEKIPKRVSIKGYLIHTSLLLVPVVVIRLLANQYNFKLENTDLVFSVLALLANYYLIKKITDGWMIYFIVNVGLCYILIQSESYILFGLNLVLAILSIIGYIKWITKELNNKTLICTNQD